jgi:PAS domain S-box-containing protein
VSAKRRTIQRAPGVPRDQGRRLPGRTAKSGSVNRQDAGRALPPTLRAALATIGELFKTVSDTAFFVKDAEGRYVFCNQSLIERCGLRGQAEIVGHHVREIFPSELGERYAAQDEHVLRTGRPVIDRLELHWYPRRRTGWCLTTKQPLRDENGNIVGLIGISRDLRSPSDASGIPEGLVFALEYLDASFHEPLSPVRLAHRAGLSPVRFARLIKRIFHLTPTQLIGQRRLAAASRMLLETNDAVADIALACGFYDHSAFTRAFRAATGSTPTQFRGEHLEQAPKPNLQTPNKLQPSNTNRRPRGQDPS